MARSFVAEARRRVGPKKQRIRPIIERLIAEHPDARIALTFRTDIELLVSVLLSAQTTDVNVNRVTATLFEPTISFKKRGMGLGLSIAKKNALLSGGDVIVIPGELGGAAFRVSLPS